jgi:hypothetical protein
MRFKVNFLAFSNNEAEMTKKMMGYDIDQPIPDFEGLQANEKEDEEKNSCS